MKKLYITLAVLGTATTVGAQAKPFVYPQKGQTQQQQDVDTAECTRWAQGQSGVDPNAPPQQGQPGQHGRGAVRGAARGAAAGAAVGAIAGDAGKGAGAGAAVGAVAGRRRSKMDQQAQQAGAADSFNRAFGACMEGRGYSVK
jgi:hypothetical protein